MIVIPEKLHNDQRREHYEEVDDIQMPQQASMVSTLPLQSWLWPPPSQTSAPQLYSGVTLRHCIAHKLISDTKLSCLPEGRILAKRLAG